MTTIYSNYDLYKNFDETKQFLIDEYEMEDPSDEQVWARINDDDGWAWDDAWDDLTSFFKNKPVIMTGTFGAWNGTYKGGKIGWFADLWYDLVKECDYVEITDNNGHFLIRCSHHDGTNNVEVKLLTDKATTLVENWEDNVDGKYNYGEEKLHDKIMGCNFLSKIPHFAKTVYGMEA